MKVQITTRDKNLEVVDTKEYDFIDFCDLLSRRVKSVLYLIDDYLDPESSVEFKDVRKSILDVSGEIGRLPINIREEGV